LIWTCMKSLKYSSEDEPMSSLKFNVFYGCKSTMVLTKAPGVVKPITPLIPYSG